MHYLATYIYNTLTLKNFLFSAYEGLDNCICSQVPNKKGVLMKREVSKVLKFKKLGVKINMRIGI